ncbi:MAG: DNA-3-methyladenine glycosylase family protein [Thermoplasmatota archaeon]
MPFPTSRISSAATASRRSCSPSCTSRSAWRRPAPSRGRLIKLLGGKITPRRLLNRSPDQLRSAGLSRAKAAYVLDLADKTARGDVEFERFPDMTDEAILAELTAVKGIGVWTAQMFLMFHLHRPDVLATGDLGLRLAVADVYKVPENEAADEMLARREQWSPYCSVAARVLWQSRRATGV